MEEYKYREEWLLSAVEELRKYFEIKGLKLPTNIKVSCGWTGKNISKTLGSCWDNTVSRNNFYEIFISPILDDVVGSQGVVANLIHELTHALLGVQEKHGKKFKIAIKKLGLTGKSTSTYADSELITDVIKPLAEKLGTYPHGSINLEVKEKKARNKNILDAYCPNCGYEIKVKVKFLDKGIPKCPMCEIEFVVEDISLEEGN